jgi:hypothetical protein
VVEAVPVEEPVEIVEPKEEEVTPDKMTGREAFFALVGIKMMALS